MSDIVERMRNHVNYRGGPTIENSAWQMMLESADEIERLRAAIFEKETVAEIRAAASRKNYVTVKND